MPGQGDSGPRSASIGVLPEGLLIGGQGKNPCEMRVGRKPAQDFSQIALNLFSMLS
jgi:hypothetical protein